MRTLIEVIKRQRLLLVGGIVLLGALVVAAMATAFPAGAQSTPASAGKQSANNGGCMDNMAGANNSTVGNSGMSGMSGMGSMMGDVDRHFIEQMIPHHQSAIAMADLALQKAQRPEIKALAADIKRTQTAEIVQMRGWYKEWYGVDVPASSTNDSTGGMMGSSGMMGKGMMRGGMMGSDMNINGSAQDLATATDFDKAFIEQMIPHHQMAVMMAGMVLAGGEKAELRTLVQSISTSQSAEIVKMRAWYKSWYGTSAP